MKEPLVSSVCGEKPATVLFLKAASLIGCLNFLSLSEGFFRYAWIWFLFWSDLSVCQILHLVFYPCIYWAVILKSLPNNCVVWNPCTSVSVVDCFSCFSFMWFIFLIDWLFICLVTYLLLFGGRHCLEKLWKHIPTWDGVFSLHRNFASLLAGSLGC